MLMYRRICGADISGHRAPSLLYCGRGMGCTALGDVAPNVDGWLGNPFRPADEGLERCLSMFEEAFLAKLRFDSAFALALTMWRIREQGGERVEVGCWCDSPSKCHTQYITKFLQGGYDREIKSWQASSRRV